MRSSEQELKIKHREENTVQKQATIYNESSVNIKKNKNKNLKFGHFKA